MAQIVLRCMVPVYVYVDTKPGNVGVDLVVVDHEALNLATAELADINERWSEQRRSAICKVGIRAAADAYEWPAWQFGF